MSQKLDLSKVEITTEHFVPNVIMDKNLYDDVTMESGQLVFNIRCKNDESEIRKNITKAIMMLQAYNDGYVKSINGAEHGLYVVFGIVGQPSYRYVGNNTVELTMDIISLVYGVDMHLALVNECLSAGATTALMPDSKHYFRVKMDDMLLKKPNSETLITALESQRNKFKSAVVSNMRPL